MVARLVLPSSSSGEAASGQVFAPDQQATQRPTSSATATASAASQTADPKPTAPKPMKGQARSYCGERTWASRKPNFWKPLQTTRCICHPSAISLLWKKGATWCPIPPPLASHLTCSSAFSGLCSPEVCLLLYHESPKLNIFL